MRTRSTVKRLPAAVLGLAVLVSLAGSSAIARKEGESRRPERVSRWMDRRDPRGFRASLMRLARTKDPLASATRVVRLALADAAPGESGWYFEDESFLLPAGDLNGDGREDALEWGGSWLAGVRGHDGRTLWSTYFPGFGAPILAGDLDGISGDDLILVTAVTQQHTGAYRTTITYTAMSGRDGAEIWTSSFQNPWTDVRAGPTRAGADLGFVIPMGVGRIDGDQVTDLLLGRYHAVFARDPATGLQEASVAAAFEPISGATGRRIATFAGTGRFAAPDAVVVADLTGDGADDVVVASLRRSGPRVTARLAAHPGAGAAPAAWNTELVLDGLPWLQPLELNGDRRGDLLVTAGWARSQLIAVSGRNGKTMWTRSLSRAWGLPAGDSNGDGGTELLYLFEPAPFWYAVPLTSAQEPRVPALPGHVAGASSPVCYGYGGYGGYGGCGNPCVVYADAVRGGSGSADTHYGYGGYGGGCEPRQHLGLFDGALGETLWSSTHPRSAYVDFVGDATGDGLADALLTDESFEDEVWSVTSSLVSGADGAEAWEVVDQDFRYRFGAGGDLDADGSDDLVEVTFGDRDAIQAVRGDTGRPMWSQPVRLNGWLASSAAASLRGGAGSDLLLSVYREGGSARTGDEGALIWRR